MAAEAETPSARARADSLGGLERREQAGGVVELLELDDLAVLERDEVGLARVDGTPGLAVGPRRRSAHRDAVAVDDEVVRRVVDHLPVAEQALEVPLHLGLRAHFLREGCPGPALGERAQTDVVGEELHPALHALALRRVPGTVRVTKLGQIRRIRRLHRYHLTPRCPS